MGELWIPGAERLTPSAPGGEIVSTAEPRVVWHTTQAPSGDPRMFGRMHGVLTGKSAEPHVLIDPKTDRMGQYFPLNLSGRALKNDTDGTRNNRVGRVCIQVEVVAYAEDPFTDDWTPGPNWRALMAAVHSHGIPDVLPAGRFPKFIADPPHNEPEDDRDRATWRTKGGHYSHSQIPGNSHGDPGAIAMAEIFALGKPLTPDTEDPLMAVTDADAAKIGAATAAAIAPLLKAETAAEYAGDQKLVVADNRYDSQRAAYEAVAQAEAAHILAGGTPHTTDELKAAHNAIWTYLRPLWA